MARTTRQGCHLRSPHPRNDRLHAMVDGSESKTLFSRMSTTVSQLRMSFAHHAAKLTLMQSHPCPIFRYRTHTSTSPPLDSEMSTSKQKWILGIGVSFKSNVYSFRRSVFAAFSVLGHYGFCGIQALALIRSTSAPYSTLSIATPLRRHPGRA